MIRFIKRQIGRCRKFGYYNYAVRQWLSDMGVLFGDLFGYVVIVTACDCVLIVLIHLHLINALARGRFSLAAQDVLAAGLIWSGIVAMWFLQHWINVYIFPRKAHGAGFKERTRLEFEAEMRTRNSV